MNSKNDSPSSELSKLIDIMETLRGPEGCPWDKKQTPDSLKPYLLEEVYELLEALDGKDSNHIRDELGDLLLQIVFLSQIFREKKLFDFSDVAKSISTKMVRRHPHVFAEENPIEHAQNWERIKKEERSQQGQSEKLKDRIPQALPALKKATKVAKKMPQKETELIIEKLIDLATSLRQSMKETHLQSRVMQTDLLARILFTVVTLSVATGNDAEDTLREKTDEILLLIDD